jgi:hypothetical protein
VFIFTFWINLINLKVMLEEGIATSTEPLSALKNPEYLARAANRHRQKKQPAEPSSLDFEINKDHIPADFLQSDVKVDGWRHLVFATENMLSLLKRSKTWYVDGTFKVVKAPFTQLFTIHAFVRSGECAKQIPLAFILMSGKRKRDYGKVLKVIKEITKERKLAKFVLDFESALWRAIPHVFPGVLIQECSFHWAQCIWRKVQDIVLAPAYKHDNATHKLCRQFLALPYLPKEHIPAMFENLVTKATTPMLTDLVTYIRVNWIEGNYRL